MPANNSKTVKEKPKLRCAIYTRKSREEGLEQNFNSLDAQRLSAENYIASQQHEGWTLVPAHYDDGGYSGGNMERPALKRLLEDVQEDNIDCIVFYKLDRLSRSMIDFSRMLVFFDEHDVKFVSVTEAFDTTKSSGRLAFNMLLSVAQYERDLASERIRDKFAASKKKGMWMGGTIPTGYDVTDRTLVINETEADIIRFIYQRFVEIQSITTLVRELHQKDVTMKQWVSQTGHQCGGQPFDKNNVRRILDNPIYRGKIQHKDECYEGQHNAIIDENIWEKVRDIFKQRHRPYHLTDRLTSLPLLQGLLYCGECNGRLSPTHTQKGSRHYRYYICEYVKRGKKDSCRINRISAVEVEQVVINYVIELLQKPEIVAHTIAASEGKLTEADIITALKSAHSVWDELFPVEQMRLIKLLIKSVIVMQDHLKINVYKAGLFSLTSELNKTEATHAH